MLSHYKFIKKWFCKSSFYLGILIPCFSLLFILPTLDKTIIGTYFLFAVMLIFLLSFITKKSLFIPLVFVSSLFFSLGVFVEFSYTYLFKVVMVYRTIFAVLETNSHEASEFLSQYLKPEVLVLGIIFFCSTILSAFLGYHYFHRYKKYTIPEYVKLPIILLCMLLCVIKGRFFFTATIFGILDYSKELSILNSIPITDTGRFHDVISTTSFEKEIFVLIIGESTTRHRMGLYDYYRKTNPLLNKRREQLKIYNQVIAPHILTTPSLRKALTLGDNEDLFEKYNHTLIQLFNAARFNTYWVSNQEALGINLTPIRRISKTSKFNFFTDGNLLDEVLLPIVENCLNVKGNKKFIVIHLMGTHVLYNRRYPSKFDVFKSIPTTNFPSKEAYKTINEYDNAILYNDYIVDRIIGQVEKQNAYSFILYLSDHGEDVYQTINLASRAPNISSKPMFDIPFVIWMSEKYENDRKDLIFKTARKYNSENLFHTVADLANIRFSEFNPAKSIVNQYFKEEERLINNGQKYEVIFKKKSKKHVYYFLHPIFYVP